ncbi:cyanophycin synthetase [Propionivibrio limicola]|uniref:cyanophycin synthetase n=1 Tax=Propionivibrio limicola TaxID=167645 RepID=UPI00129113AF|nr:cyanophycin synthetase [Propionivibrio limicola]
MKTKDIKFLDIRHLRGPNMWTYRPVLEAIVDIGDLEDCPSNTIPGYYERLKDMLPSLYEHRCSYEEPGGFLRRVQEGTWPAHILEHVTLELQNLAGLPGGFGKARGTSERGVYKVVVRAWQEQVTHAALHEARELIMAAMEDRPFDVKASVEKLADMVDSLCLGPSTASIVDAADDRNIPCIRLLETGNLVQLAYGAAMRRIWTAETDQTSAIAEGISRDKDLTKTLLQNCGVPVPEGREVDSPEDAWEAAEDIGLPVCVKPVDGNHGRGVFIDLNTREEIEMAYKIAVDEGSGVLVERSIPGSEHRLLIIGGKMVAANRGDVVKVTGDGKHTIRELIDIQINSDPRRGPSESHPLSNIRIDSAARIELSRQKLDAESIPAEGREVLIQRNANHEFDVTDEVHPETAALASLAARIVGLDIAGIDLVVEDISKPLAEQGGAIVEVNAGPGLLMHLKPGVGKPRPVGKAIVEHLFPNNGTGRIPLVGITGSYGKTTVAQIIARLLTLSGKHTGLVCSKGVFFDRRQSETGDCARWEHMNRLLMNRAIEAAVFENGSDTIVGEGLAYDRCQIGVVTNLDVARHTGRHYIETPEQVFNALRTQVDLVLDDGAAILNAKEPMLVDMAPLCDGEVIFFAYDPALPVITEHLEQGKRAVIVRYGQIMLASREGEVSLAKLKDIPLTEGGKNVEQTENVLAAVGATWALGVSPDVMRTGIETFFVDQE